MQAIERGIEHLVQDELAACDQCGGNETFAENTDQGKVELPVADCDSQHNAGNDKHLLDAVIEAGNTDMRGQPLRKRIPHPQFR